MRHILFFVSFCFFSCKVFSNEPIDIEIVKSNANEWTLTYKVSEAVEKLHFNSSPDNSRIARWKPLGNFEIVIENGREVIRQLNSDKFQKVSFQLKPTYISLPKEYAPFSAFSDGGMLFHSGRFFVCTTLCENSLDRKWKITILAPHSEYIVAKGKIFEEKAILIDDKEGQKIYVGTNAPEENKHVISIIDKQLPSQLKQVLAIELPHLMDYYANIFGKLKSKPMLFASYSGGNDGRYGNQGGTLSNQIFMHWYGDNLLDNVNTYKVAWFFSHEIAHYYQFEGSEIEKIEEQWIHEGWAEYMAYKSLSGQNKESNDGAVTQLNKNMKSCVDKTKNKNFIQLVQAQDHRILYECGIVVWKGIDKELLKDEMTVKKVWALYLEEIRKGNQANLETLLSVLKPFLEEQTMNTISNINTARSPEFSRLVNRD